MRRIGNRYINWATHPLQQLPQRAAKCLFITKFMIPKKLKWLFKKFEIYLKLQVWGDIILSLLIKS